VCVCVCVCVCVPRRADARGGGGAVHHNLNLLLDGMVDLMAWSLPECTAEETGWASQTDRTVLGANPDPQLRRS
jgi:hypothetical protein